MATVTAVLQEDLLHKFKNQLKYSTNHPNNSSHSKIKLREDLVSKQIFLNLSKTIQTISNTNSLLCNSKDLSL